MAARTLPRPPLVLLACGVTAALLTGCSNGKSDFNGNRPDPAPVLDQVVRTPSPLGTDLPYSDPPLGQTLPGPTGGVAGEVPTTAPPASPGEAQDGGGASN